MQARLRATVLEVLARNQRDDVKIGRNGGHLGGVVEEGVRMFVRNFQVDKMRPFSSRVCNSKIIRGRGACFVVPKVCNIYGELEGVSVGVERLRPLSPSLFA